MSSMLLDWQARLGHILDAPLTSCVPLTGGCVAEVFQVRSGGDDFVVKVDREETQTLLLEAKMLRFLKAQTSLRVPEVVHACPLFLLMEHVPGTTGAQGLAEDDAAHQLAMLHRCSWTHFGLPFSTVIGALHQPNDISQKWLPFFRDRRLLYMGTKAMDNGHLSVDVFQKLERLCNQLENYIAEPAQPGLIHGDVWSGNILSAPNGTCCFIDPAIYYADSEIELAFITLFSTFSERFFHVYREHNPIGDHFFEERRHVYNLYPLLVHAALFGGGYGEQVNTILDSLGF